MSFLKTLTDNCDGHSRDFIDATTSRPSESMWEQLALHSTQRNHAAGLAYLESVIRDYTAGTSKKVADWRGLQPSPKANDPLDWGEI